MMIMLDTSLYIYCQGQSMGSTEPNWKRLVDLAQTAFREGRLAEEAT